MRRSAGAALLDVCALLLLLAVLMAPDRPHPDWSPWNAVPPLEFALLLILAVVGGRILRLSAAGLLSLVAVLKLLDVVCHAAYARPFNPVLDIGLFWAAFDTLSGAVGRDTAYALSAAAAGAIIGLVALIFWSVARLARVTAARRRTVLAAAVVSAVAALAVIPARPDLATAPSRLLVGHGLAIGAGVSDLAEFRRLAGEDPWADVPAGDLLTGLAGKDVLVVFVESYGRTLLDRAEFSAAIEPLLADGSKRLAQAGWSVRSAFLTSPTVGGLSWLAHGTALSGLWIDNQRRYDALVSGDRMTLNAAFRKAGWRTVAVMPAIRFAWPEGGFYGYDRIYAAGDLGYRGPPFNWVTMPDQYTLSAFERLERGAGPRSPVMAEIALISSHAPWTPVPALVDWDAIGDGSGVFDAMVAAGDPPEVVWRDPDRVRLQFRQTIDYSLRTLVSYAERNAGRDLVILVLGDHQPAQVITGETDNRDVPVHLITRDPRVLAEIAPWGWTDGLRPADTAPVWRMDRLRDALLATFSSVD